MAQADHQSLTKLLDGFIASVRDVLITPGAKSETSLYTQFESFLVAAIPAAQPAANDFNFVAQAGADEAGIPDYRVQSGNELKGWVEVKAVIGKDLNHLKGHDATQMERFVSGLDNVIYTTGWQWRLYQHGQQIGRDVVLGPSTMFDPDGLGYDVTDDVVYEIAVLLANFAAAPTQDYSSAQAAVKALASRAKALKLALVTVGRDGAGDHLVELESDFRGLLYRNGLPFTWEKFVDSYVQLATFGVLLWRLETGKPIALNQQVGISQGLHPLLAQCLAILWQPQSRITIVAPLLEELCRTVNNINPALFQTKEKQSSGRRRYVPDPIVHAYEPFFEQYDPATRDSSGVFYTPVEVVEHIVDGIEDLLIGSLNRPDGLLDESAQFLDPATGTGTFLIGLANAVAAAAADAGLPTDQMVEQVLTEHSSAFELFVGPYTIAHQRLEVALKTFGVVPKKRLPIYLADTLAAPVAGTLEESGFGIAGDEIKKERAGADHVKTAEDILVIFGNPPYERVKQSSGGGFEPFAQHLFNELREATPSEYRADLKSTKDLFVAFWAWTLWALQPPEKRLGNIDSPTIDPPSCNGIAAFITNRTWISGRSLVGLRRLVRRGAKEIWICDIGGDSRGAAGARKWAGGDANVFSIRTGVAIAWIVFDREHDGPPTVRYRRLYGNKAKKLATLQERFSRDDFEEIGGSDIDPFLPNRWGDSPLATSPRIPDLFTDEPETGIQTARDTRKYTPIGTHAAEVYAVAEGKKKAHAVGSLAEWAQLNKTDQFTEWATAQRKRTKGAKPPDPSGLAPDRVREFLYRPLDFRWVYDDPSWIDWFRPNLHRVYLGERRVPTLLTNPRDHGAGPAVLHVDRLAEQHAFNNRGAKGLYPLWRPQPEGQPPVDKRKPLKDGMRCGFSPMVLDWLDELDRSGQVESAYDYILAVLSAPAYTANHWSALENDTLRVPLTSDADVFEAGAQLGAQLRDVWTLQVPKHPDVAWKGTSSEPLGKARHQDTRIVFSNGRELEGVTADVWTFEVSGYRVLQEWFKARPHWTATVSEAKTANAVVSSIRKYLDLGPSLDDVYTRALSTATERVEATETAGLEPVEPPAEATSVEDDGALLL